MKKIFKNMIPYWRMIIAIFILLIVQAYCDLALPQYTSDIIDTGIQNSGVEHILPEAITQKEYEYATLYMTEDEKASWEASYILDADMYSLNVTDEKQLDELDETLLTPIVLTYQMANMSESDFKDMVAQSMAGKPQTEGYVNQLEDMSIDDIGAMMQLKLSWFTGYSGHK